jgi:acetyl esterase/lipase
MTIKQNPSVFDALRDEGIATWSIEYRRTDNMGGGWPGTFQDVAAAADLLPTVAKKYSLDLSRVIIIGQSAGGHFALWLAGRHNLPVSSVLYKKNPLSVRGVISLGGVPDLFAFREQAKNICDSGDVIGKLVGEGTMENYTKNFKEASPSELLPLGTKQILIYGEDEASVPVKFGEAYKIIALSKGDNVSVITVKYAAHHEYNVPNSVTWPVILTNVKNLLK